MKKTFFFLLVFILSDSALASEDEVSWGAYGFHPHVLNSFAKDRSLLGFDLHRDLAIVHKSVDVNIEIDIEESHSEQEFHGSVELIRRNDFIDIHLRAALDTGFFYKNEIEAEIALGKEFNFLEKLKIFPEIHFLKLGKNLETDFMISVSREI